MAKSKKFYSKLSWKPRMVSKTKKGNMMVLQSAKKSFVGRKLVVSKNKGKKAPWSVLVTYVRKPYTAYFRTYDQAMDFVDNGKK